MGGGGAKVAICAANTGRLRVLVVGVGLAWSLSFIIVGVQYDLSAYGDGALFSYAVAAQDAWAFHWHNISGRVFVYILAYWPVETYVGLTGDARGGLVLHGLLFFAAQMAGLGLAYAADRSKNRIIFSFACASTACLCPLVFGFPTEMWVAHAVFWPVLALSHYAPPSMAGHAMLAAGFAALVLSHGGGVVLAIIILATVALRGARDPALLRAASALLLSILLWGGLLLVVRPDPYIAKVITTAAFSFIDPRNFLAPASILLVTALLSYASLTLLFRQVATPPAYLVPVVPVVLVLSGLTVYWQWFDQAILAEHRYPLRTALLVVTPAFGVLAAAYALRAEGRLGMGGPSLLRLLATLQGLIAPRHLINLLVIVSVVHAVETVKFVSAWNDYELAVRALAMNQMSDPALGDQRFVSANRIDKSLDRLSWTSTTHFLSVLVAPGFKPSRLVVSPDPAYRWLDCGIATASFRAPRAMPVESRGLIRAHACSN